jgi:hypothetical protein
MLFEVLKLELLKTGLGFKFYGFAYKFIEIKIEAIGEMKKNRIVFKE